MAPTTPSTFADVRAVRLAEIAASAGTPCYVYDANRIRDAYAALERAFDGYPHAIHYALKANSSLAVVRLLQSCGAHADANSLGEVDVALLQHVGRPRGYDRIVGQVAAAVEQGACGQQGELGVVGAARAVVEVGDDAVALAVVLHAPQVAQRVAHRQPDKAADGAVAQGWAAMVAVAFAQGCLISWIGCGAAR